MVLPVQAKAKAKADAKGTAETPKAPSKFQVSGFRVSGYRGLGLRDLGGKGLGFRVGFRASVVS